jgi:nitrate/nitrite-specific signal transduction histidine kinase
MRERLQSLNGAVKVTGAANRGTSLELTLPLESESAAQLAGQMVGEADSL